jgi:hypothetical protein
MSLNQYRLMTKITQPSRQMKWIRINFGKVGKFINKKSFFCTVSISEESGSPKSPSGKVNLAATVPSNSPTKPPTPIKPTSSPVKSNPGVVRREMKKSAAKSKGSGSVKTTITQTEDDDSTYENLQNLCELFPNLFSIVKLFAI